MLPHFLLIALLAAPSARQEGRVALTPARDALSAHFTRAMREPAGVVPLLLAASAEIERLPPQEALLLADTLEPFARRVFFGPEDLPGMQDLGVVTCTVAKGELASRICARRKVGAGLLPYTNEGYNEKQLRPGQRLKLIDNTRGDLELVVDRAGYRLLAWKQTQAGQRVLVMCVPVGLGAASSPTPAGTTTITKRVLEPAWTHPETRAVYAHGDPRNVLGGYWIALDEAGLGRSGIGLHGYTGEASARWIEQPASHGCVRLLQGDIDRVYHLALEGTRVVIR